MIPACFVTLVLLAGSAGIAGIAGDKPVSLETLGIQFERDVRPLLQQFCLDCHSTEQQEGELDLERFGTFVAVRRDPQS